MPRVVGVRLFGDLPRGSTATDLVLVDQQHAARARRRRLVRRVRRRRPGVAGAGRPGDDLQHVARVRRDGRALPDRRRDARLPAPDRPDRRARRAGRALRQGERAVARAGRRSRLRRGARARPVDRRADPGRPAPAAGQGPPARPARRTSASASPAPTSTASRSTVGVDGAVGRRSTTARWPSPPSPPAPTRQQPDGDDRRRAAGAQCARPRADGQADGQDEPGARLARRDRVPHRGRPARAARAARLRRRRLRLHDVHRQQRAARRAGRAGDRGATTWSSRRCCRATATSRAASIRWPGPATSPRRRWSSPSRWPARSTSTCSTEPLGTDRDGEPVFLADIWPTPEEISETIARSVSPDIFERIYGERVRRRRALARPARAGRQRPLRVGRATRPTSRGRRSSTA